MQGKWRKVQHFQDLQKHSPNLPFNKGEWGMRFFNDGSNGGEDGKFWIEMGGSQEWEDWFYNERGEKFLVKVPLYCLLPSPPSFFKFCPNPFPRLLCHLQPPLQLFFQLTLFFGWMFDHATFDVLFYLMIIWIYTNQALLPGYQKDLDVCFMQQNIRFTDGLCIKASAT